MFRIIIIHLIIVLSHLSIDSFAQNNLLFKTFKSGDVCYTIGDKYAGEFILGDEIPHQEYLDHFKIRKENTSKDFCYIISENNHDLIVLIPQKESAGAQTVEIIKEIRVIANKFKTPRGITVNSDVEDLIRTYPDCQVSYYKDQNLIAFEPEETDAKFLIQKEDFLGSDEELNHLANLDLSKFKAHSKIIEVRLL